MLSPPLDLYDFESSVNESCSSNSFYSASLSLSMILPICRCKSPITWSLSWITSFSSFTAESFSDCWAWISWNYIRDCFDCWVKPLIILSFSSRAWFISWIWAADLVSSTCGLSSIKETYCCWSYLTMMLVWVDEFLPKSAGVIWMLLDTICCLVLIRSSYLVWIKCWLISSWSLLWACTLICS